MKLRLTAALLAVLTAGSTFAADQVVVTDQGIGTFTYFRPASVRLDISTLGYGGGVAFSLNRKTELSIGYNGGKISYKADLGKKSVDWQTKLDMDNTSIVALYRPWGNWFNIQAGSIVQNDHITGKAKPKTNGTKAVYSLNGYDYNAVASTGGVGNLETSIKFNNTLAPYLAVGLSPSITTHWGLFGSVGVAYFGNPHVTSMVYNTSKNDLRPYGPDNSTTSCSTCPTFKQSLDQERKAIQNDDKYRYFPVVKLGIGYRF